MICVYSLCKQDAGSGATTVACHSLTYAIKTCQSGEAKTTAGVDGDVSTACGEVRHCPREK